MEQFSRGRFTTIPCSPRQSASFPIPDIVAIQVFVEEMVEAPTDTRQERDVLFILQVPADLNYDLIGEFVDCHSRQKQSAIFL